MTSQGRRLIETCGKMCGMVNGTGVINRYKFCSSVFNNYASRRKGKG